MDIVPTEKLRLAARYRKYALRVQSAPRYPPARTGLAAAGPLSPA